MERAVRCKTKKFTLRKVSIFFTTCMDKIPASRQRQFAAPLCGEKVRERSFLLSLILNATPLLPCKPVYNLHEMAGGLPLRCCSASNIRFREACN